MTELRKYDYGAGLTFTEPSQWPAKRRGLSRPWLWVALFAVIFASSLVGVATSARPVLANVTTSDMTLHNGPIMPGPTIHLVFWSPSTLQDGTTSGSFDSSYIGALKQFFQDVGGHGLDNVMKQYRGNNGATPNGSKFGDIFVDPTPFPHQGCTLFGIGGGNCLNDQQLRDDLEHLKDHGAPTDAIRGLNDLYFLFLPKGEDLCTNRSHDFGLGKQCFSQSGPFCAYHDRDTFTFGPDIYYAAMPFVSTGNCHTPGNPNDPSGVIDPEINAASHELFESLTDPQTSEPITGSGWFGPGGSDDEIGDKCSYDFGGPSHSANVFDNGQADEFWNGHYYEIQGEWSNHAHGCVWQGDSAAQYQPGCAQNTLPPNDDGTSPAVALPFTLNFFGNSYSSLFVNNNGNVTFNSALPTFTPFGLLATHTPIIAPYFADVDTRGAGSGFVTYGSAPSHGTNPAYFCVNWFDVGYFEAHTDKTNSFQLVLIDRSAQTGHPGDFDITFNYDRVQWETGDASGGSGGLGGTSARVGYSNGTSRSVEIQGSGQNGALLDGGVDSLSTGSRNSTQPGRYNFPVRSGSSTSGNIDGTVTDSSSPPAPVSGATLQFCTIVGTSQACGIASTNALGHYSVTGLPPGQYRVRVSPPAGSSLFERDLGPIALADQATVQLDVALAGPRGLTPGTTITNLHSNPGGTPVLDWRTTNILTTHGCVGGAASYTMTIANNQYGNPVSGPMAATPAGSGTYVATIPPLYPQYGPAQVVISIICPNPSQNQTITFDVYVDPSGSVVDQSGNPVSGATVTLFRADAASGPFTEVPAGSSIMSPANRLNPDTSTTTGRFGWDVLQGYYEIRASKAGCTAPGNPSQAYVQSPVEQIPPPAANLVLTLQCSIQPTTSTLTSSLNPSAYGQSVTLADTVTAGSGSPSGSVILYDGATSLGPATLSAGGKATLVTSTLSVGSHAIKAVYAGDGSFLGSTSNTVVQVINYTSCVTGSRNGGLTVPSGQAICVTGTGRVNGTTTVQSGGLLYLNGGTLNGRVTVQSGGALFVNGGTINGGVASTGAKALSVCGGRVNGGLSASGSTGFVLVGDGGDGSSPGCAGSTINGNVTLTSNASGVEVSGNTVNGTVTLISNAGGGPSTKHVVELNHVNGSLACTNNNPAPINDGHPNSVSGSRAGQCSAAGF